MPLEELKRHNDKHRANAFLDQYAKERQTLFVYVLADVEAEPEPKPYSHSTGDWCRVREGSQGAIEPNYTRDKFHYDS
jgi:hypothetical protein